MRLPTASMLMAAIAISSCVSESAGASGDSVEETRVASTETTSELPPIIDATDLIGSDTVVDLRQLRGLTEAEAREWGRLSGFEEIYDQDDEYVTVLSPGERLILEVEDGIVRSANSS